ncbi:MAG: histidine phosphatase family protein [Myxococcales bacterium]|nr:histidine phosphatase family protein [Myxococcales bacterium]
MSALFLVRHAQASFMSDDYDRLSDHGVEQARRLGCYFQAHRWSIDAVFSGPRRRHRHTAEAILEQLGSPPELECLPELDEYPADLLLPARLPDLLQARPELGAVAQDLAASDLRRRGRALDLLLREALVDWALTDAPDAGHESFGEFQRRLERARARVTRDDGRGRRILCVTSAGTIGALVAQILSASAQVALDLGFMIHNSSLTEIAFTPGRSGLASFNALPHLPDPADWTRR